MNISEIPKKIRNAIYEILRLICVLTPAFASIFLIQQMYGIDMAFKSTQYLSVIICSVIGFMCALSLLKKLLNEATDAIQNLKSTKNVLLNGCGAAMIFLGIYAFAPNSFKNLYELEDGNVIGIIFLVFVVVVSAIGYIAITSKKAEHQ
ncbi:MAG: hypothetical protein WA093_00770 [Minisyncoccales bacterium]